MTAERISSELYLSTNTVETHIRNLRRKLGASSRAEAVGCAVVAGIYDPGTGRIDPLALARLQGQGAAEVNRPPSAWRWRPAWRRARPRTAAM